MKYDSKKGMPFKPCKDCPTPGKCIKAGKCLAAEEKPMKAMGKMAAAMGLKK